MGLILPLMNILSGYAVTTLALIIMEKKAVNPQVI